MRLIPSVLMAGLLALGLFATAGPAAADSRIASGLANLDGIQGTVEKITYYGRGYGGYGRHYGYRRHYGHRGYGYRRHYGYGYRRHYGYRRYYRPYRRHYYGYHRPYYRGYYRRHYRYY